MKRKKQNMLRKNISQKKTTKNGLDKLAWVEVERSVSNEATRLTLMETMDLTQVFKVVSHCFQEDAVPRLGTSLNSGGALSTGRSSSSSTTLLSCLWRLSELRLGVEVPREDAPWRIAARAEGRVLTIPQQHNNNLKLKKTKERRKGIVTQESQK